MENKIPNSVQFIKGVGPKWAKTLGALDIYSVRDLLYYFPRDYEDRRKVTKVKNVQPGQKYTLKVKVANIKIEKPRKGLKILKVSFSDNSGVINGLWFNQLYIKKQFKKGKWFYLYGEINEESWKYRKVEINNPVFEKADSKVSIHTKRIVPIYSLTKNLTQKRLRKIIYHAIKDYAIHLEDILPDFIIKKYNFSQIHKSLKGLHFPENKNHFLKSRNRLAFEELFLFQLQVLNRKKGITEKKGISHNPPGKILENFKKSLSFSLTSAQKQAWSEIKQDMEKEIVMQRLLQGDVGSGKTVVAVLALIETMSNGYQGVFMAPTEILAEQHYLKLEDLLGSMGFKVSLLIGSLNQKKKKQIEKNISENKVDLIIGTHALFQEKINYNDIGLVVIDEQHRFGVEQRYKLKEKGENPDLLVMTATPIPRSLALTLYGDLDLSVIDELPPGRKPVKTYWRRKKHRDNVYKFVRDKLSSGEQAFVVCPLIEPSEEISAASAQKVKEELQNVKLKNYRVQILHSKIRPKKKKKAMNKFRKGEIDVIVSTTVVEVGVDVPNASMMVIENAERFGLAQLHQLRGRVGRGEHQAYCIALAEPGTEKSIKRLNIFADTNDGFKIAEEDLKIRGPGEFFGKKQHGMPDLQVANVLKDKKLLNLARKESKLLLNKDEWQNIYPNLYDRMQELEIKV